MSSRAIDAHGGLAIVWTADRARNGQWPREPTGDWRPMCSWNRSPAFFNGEDDDAMASIQDPHYFRCRPPYIDTRRDSIHRLGTTLECLTSFHSSSAMLSNVVSLSSSCALGTTKNTEIVPCFSDGVNEDATPVSQVTGPTLVTRAGREIHSILWPVSRTCHVIVT